MVAKLFINPYGLITRCYQHRGSNKRLTKFGSRPFIMTWRKWRKWIGRPETDLGVGGEVAVPPPPLPLWLFGHKINPSISSISTRKVNFSSEGGGGGGAMRSATIYLVPSFWLFWICPCARRRAGEPYGTRGFLNSSRSLSIPRSLKDNRGQIVAT